MVRFLGLTRGVTDEPQEITSRPSLSSESGENGWLIRFFDSAFFCEWIAVSYLYKHEHSGDSGFPCFKGGPRTIQNSQKRFHLSLTEEQCVSLVLSLISSSLDAWRTRQYDYYQRVLNGIL